MSQPTLTRQVEGVLTPRLGGTGNALGVAQGTLFAIENRTGSTLPQWTAVILDGSGNIALTTLDSQVPVLGVVAGEFDASGALIPGDCSGSGSGHIAAVITAGVVPMIFETWDDSTNGIGEYVYTTAAVAGHVYAKLTRSAGALGVLLSSTRSSGPGSKLMVAMWSGVALAGPLQLHQEGGIVNAESDALDFAGVLPAHSYGHTSAIDIAPELLGG